MARWRCSRFVRDDLVAGAVVARSGDGLCFPLKVFMVECWGRDRLEWSIGAGLRYAARRPCFWGLALVE